MRQVGFLAAAGLVALDTIVPRLFEDHQKTRKIAEGMIVELIIWRVFICISFFWKF